LAWKGKAAVLRTVPVLENKNNNEALSHQEQVSVKYLIPSYCATIRASFAVRDGMGCVGAVYKNGRLCPDDKAFRFLHNLPQSRFSEVRLNPPVYPAAR